ncbi:MAG: PDZ domain-containing protein [Planctomycetota bacterium]
MTHLRYLLDARRGRDHRFAVALEMDVHPHGGDLELFLPVWTPGSYLIREYQRHLGELRACDPVTGQAATWCKSAKNRYRFRVAPSTRRLRIDYTVFAHELTVRTADLTEDHAFWNGACLFLWPVGERDAGATIDLALPDGWSVWTWLPLESEQSRVRYSVAGLDQLVDCPVLCSADARVVDFDVAGRPHRFVFDDLAGLELPTGLAADTAEIVTQAMRVFGVESLPYERYDFLTLLSDRGHGGLEHADGSVLLAPRTNLTSPRGYRDFMGLVAHEFFHVFNVKRLRPEELWQVDYEAENHTQLLWVAEGFTAYYDDLLCCRAGVVSARKYLQTVADNIADAHRTPGRLVHPLADASYDAWIKLYRPDEDSRNSSQSYYVNGGLAALCLDLEIRVRTRGVRGLDDAMQLLWKRTYLRGRGYTYDDVVAALTDAAGSDLATLVDSLVRQPFDPDFAAALRPLGLDLVRMPLTADRPPYLGIQLQAGTTIVASVSRSGPAARGGVAAGDEILAVGGLRATNAALDEILRAIPRGHQPCSVLVARRGRILERHVTLESGEANTGYRIDVASGSSAEQDALRRGWLGKKCADDLQSSSSHAALEE